MYDQWKNNATNSRSVVSFSGGKDSSLALYHAMQTGTVIGLIVMLEEQGQRSRSHAMPLDIIHAQANAIGLPVFMASSSWADYETKFIALLEQAKQQNAEVLVTGDLDRPEHGCWHDRVTQQVGLKLGMPLWLRPHREVVEEFINLGFQSIIVTINLKLGMKIEDLGNVLTLEYIQELENRGIDPCGEGGEFHTTVIDGPIFNKAIPVRRGDIVYHEEYAFLPLELDQIEG
ncbi:diphthine--ammonia ligase [Acinetobacter haemolyticus]|uniref:Dph6-related ATP pyrophosphatase n=1 Tax=Acinetobacter haemolyticus TaxID=29430 RepID=UPI00031E763A|nr:diphthine--ammonia ligase [Acinetobacter haemolyticus]NAR51568.1 diphthine--ammonia ligase [Acinetobacter haemolyticus]NAR54895.1 diphthine--ammonia ligase [Acinetobacter haemolyticus]NAR61287.1 diphthine--ammonia ligase [Acinetobacter haemolyticus]NAR67753.1 diphthine--ammonia ligase [Acinetobacter haemolyticus]NAR70667.1 diphthine--ammonia ligase [Acinetobacter haemolyticus]